MRVYREDVNGGKRPSRCNPYAYCLHTGGCEWIWIVRRWQWRLDLLASLGTDIKLSGGAAATPLGGPRVHHGAIKSRSFTVACKYTVKRRHRSLGVGVNPTGPMGALPQRGICPGRCRCVLHRIWTLSAGGHMAFETPSQWKIDLRLSLLILLLRLIWRSTLLRAY